MSFFSKLASEIWRDYATAGVPASGSQDPVKADIRAWGAAVEAQGAANPNLGITFAWDTGTTDADPGTGEIRANNATLSSVTFLYVSETGFNGDALAAFLQSLDDSTSINKGVLILRDLANLANVAVFEVTAVTDGGTYDKIAVTYRTHTGSFAAAAGIGLVFHRTGDTVHAGLDYAFDTATTDADPGAGELRFNHATLGSATFMYISNTGRNGEALGTHIGTWDNAAATHRGHGRVFDINDRSKYIEFDLNDALTDGTTYWKVPLAAVAGGTTPAAGAILDVVFNRAGDNGSLSGALGATDNRLPRTDGTGGTTLQSTGVAVDDSNNVSGVVGLTATGTVEGAALTQGGVAVWSTVVKTADETIQSDTTLTVDTHLKFAMLANTKYAIRARILLITGSTGDFKWRHAGPASPTRVRVKRASIGGTGTAYAGIEVDVAYSAADIVVAGSAGTAWVEFDAVISNGANAGNFEFQWAQNASEAVDTTVLAGSYLEHRVVA
jgi:hypothetical protein